MAPTGKREIPTALAFMQAAAQSQPGTTYSPMSPGVSSGPDINTQNTTIPNGSNQFGKGAPSPGQGFQTPASSARGSGKKQKKVLPNKGKAKASVHRPKGHKMPPMSAVSNKLRGAGPHGNAGVSKSGGRSGILSKFEGFSKNP